MACNNQATDCAPCKDCPESPAPVLPRCQEVVLPDGVYANATVVVEEGCIVQVQAGVPMAYQPDNCCATVGGGGDGDTGPMGPPGPAGTPATVAIGTVSTVAPGEPATVTNTGTPSNAILSFEIPRGEDGDNGETAGGLDLATGEWEFDNGLLQSVPTDWPPICTLVQGVSDPATIVLTITKDPTTGITTIGVDASAMQDALDLAADELNDHENRIASLESQVTALQSAVSDIQTNCCP